SSTTTETRENAVPDQTRTAAAPAALDDAEVERGAARRALQVLVTIGVLPILLVTMIVIFGLIEPRFLGQDNILNILRQSTFLGIVAIGQMLVLVTAGFDLSIGAIVALTSVVAAT